MRQEDHVFEANLDYFVRFCLNKSKTDKQKVIAINIKNTINSSVDLKPGVNLSSPLSMEHSSSGFSQAIYIKIKMKKRLKNKRTGEI
jgi:hypothetical protein